MRKCDIVQKIVGQTGIETTDVSLVVDAFISQIKKEVGAGNRVDFRGFGVFQPRKRKAKKGHDFKTGSSIDLPEKSVPHFKPSSRYFKIKEDRV
jgi:nucleoid DNA-binding protein